ncbi:DUF4197 family protein [Novosphingobium sp. FSW06-99]|uniref:DUF4197 family protein n=1 Tax=Novosphingobium sp. FSW06-99 TaxID=1739113 RepID=UPI00076DDFFB|nr:DUF4197 family protein [Novosphingobium sp. FSW06-99]KUR77808.1 hypothetical protein AQZ49_08915 [Novosphingobium sp. FSW06-99]
MTHSRMARRAVMAGLTAVLAACAALPPFTVDEAVRRLLRRATERALARLDQPGGAWDKFVAGLNLGPGVQAVLMSPDFHRRLDAWVRPVALRAVRAAAPRIAAAVKVMGITNARAVLAGGPRAATRLLRSEMGPALIEAMVPEFARALDDPALGPLIATLAALGSEALARKLARHADDAVWDAIGDEEAAIRADPTAGGDPQLAGMLAHP